jgi:transcriptional regulator with XRE-family HTH domain
MKLHDKIKLIRLSKNLTQVYLAEELNIDAANYSRLERGETKISTERLLKIAKIFEIDSSILLENKGDVEKKDSISSVEILREILTEIRTLNKLLTK